MTHVQFSIRVFGFLFFSLLRLPLHPEEDAGKEVAALEVEPLVNCNVTFINDSAVCNMAIWQFGNNMAIWQSAMPLEVEPLVS